jgi:hypothetical protein
MLAPGLHGTASTHPSLNQAEDSGQLSLTLWYWLRFFVNHNLPNYPYCGSEITL